MFCTLSSKSSKTPCLAHCSLIPWKARSWLAGVLWKWGYQQARQRELERNFVFPLKFCLSGIHHCHHVEDNLWASKGSLLPKFNQRSNWLLGKGVFAKGRPGAYNFWYLIPNFPSPQKSPLLGNMTVIRRYGNKKFFYFRRRNSAKT